jgi:hypothetical protein
MKGLSSVFGLVAAVTLAWPVAGKADVDVHLDYVANTFVLATQQLVKELTEHMGATAHVTQDAQTLSAGADHFKEEVELGPQDLDQDFNVISQVYNDTSSDIEESLESQNLTDVREAWFDAQESWINLRQAWLEHTEAE